MAQNITRASKEWMNRPDDQRYLSLEELSQAVHNRKKECWTATPPTKSLRVTPTSDGDLGVTLYDPVSACERTISPTNFAFGQLCSYAKVPASYVRTIPAELAAINVAYGLEHSPMRNDSLILAQSNGISTLRSMTSTSYGRIWDSQVVDAVVKVNGDGRWQVPAATYSKSAPKRATTLYASDRDVFIFLVDPDNPIDVDGETLFRGFYTWNSEVGSSVFGLTTFLYRYVCDNRIIWGATEVRELRIRHTGGAPERFYYEAGQQLAKYAEEDTKAIVDGIHAAKNKVIDLNKGKDETMSDWLQKRYQFSKAQAVASVDYAEAEEGQARTVWDIVNGITAYARSIPNTDERTALEIKGSKLMEIAV